MQVVATDAWSGFRTANGLPALNRAAGLPFATAPTRVGHGASQSSSRPGLRGASPILLSFQQSDTGTVHQDVRMVVCVGDADARGFGAATQPFPVETGSGQYWNSLFVKDARTVMALSTTSIGGVWGLWSIEGRVVGPASACPLKLR